jgi:hypothetical protein
MVNTALSTPFHLDSAPTGLLDRDISTVLLSPALDTSRAIRILFYCDRSSDNGGPALVGGASTSLSRRED